MQGAIFHLIFESKTQHRVGDEMNFITVTGSYSNFLLDISCML